MNKEQKIIAVSELMSKHIRGAGDLPGVIDRMNEYMKNFIDPICFKDMRTLDVGSGDCSTADYLSKYSGIWLGINKGIDYDNNKDKYNIVDMDFHFLDFPRDSFDLVLAVNVLEHSFHPALFLFELRRVAKSYVFIDLPLDMSSGGQHCHEENPDHHYLMSNYMWKKMFNIIGLEVVKERTYGAEVQWLLKKCEPAVAC